MSRMADVFGSQPVLIGVMHLPPLPGYPASPGLNACVHHALADLAAYEAAGFDGVLIENEWDRPHRIDAGPETIAHMTAIANEAVRARRRVTIGVEVLLNDPCASLAIAAASGAQFIRTDYYVDAMAREGYGVMHIDPQGVLRFRRQIDAQSVLILADVQVKYATMLHPKGLDESARIARAHEADAIVVTGRVTGEPPTVADVDLAVSGAADVPVLIGSGLSAGNARTLLRRCNGAIVGSSLMKAGRVDPARAIELRESLQ